MRGEPMYKVEWSDEDQEWVATVRGYPSLSYLSLEPVDALDGLIGIMAKHMAQQSLQRRAQREQLDRDTGPGAVEQQLRPVSRDRPDPAAVDPVAGQGIRPVGDDQV